MCLAASPSVQAEPITATVSPERRYIPEFDGMRAIAALLVIVCHAPGGSHLVAGFIGVDIFFVLSAFLITSLLVAEQERTGGLRLGQFYWRRSIRLMPALWLLLIVYMLVAPMVKPDYPHLSDTIIAALYVSNFTSASGHFLLGLGHTWSLSTEEQFYLLWPPLLLILLRARRPVMILGALWVGLTATRVLSADSSAAYFGLATHGTGLILGAMLFFLMRDGSHVFRLFHGFLGLSILAALALLAQQIPPVLTIAPVEIATAAVIGTIVANPGALAALAWRPLVWLGKLSYGLYLWHYPIAKLMPDMQSFGLNFLIIFAASLAFASLSYFTVEKWARRYRDWPRPAAAAHA